jgi:molybdenum cofactor biosynthesis enzyme MoaA
MPTGLWNGFAELNAATSSMSTLKPFVDRFHRRISYLRVSVTRQCNFRCTYCSPDCNGDDPCSPPAITPVRYSEIIIAAGLMGFDKVRFTGGEPLLNDDLAGIIGCAKKCGSFGTIALTTNGSLLTPMKVRELYRAGLTNMTISLNTLSPGEFARITGVDALESVLDGIEAARSQPFREIKINMVISGSTTAGRIEEMRDFCRARGLMLQTIGEFSLTDRHEIEPTVLRPDRPPHCADCNRIRLTVGGTLRPCLFDDAEVVIDYSDIEGSFRRAVWLKPREGSRCTRTSIREIGG